MSRKQKPRNALYTKALMEDAAAKRAKMQEQGNPTRTHNKKLVPVPIKKERRTQCPKIWFYNGEDYVEILSEEQKSRLHSHSGEYVTFDGQSSTNGTRYASAVLKNIFSTTELDGIFARIAVKVRNSLNLADEVDIEIINVEDEERVSAFISYGLQPKLLTTLL